MELTTNIIQNIIKPHWHKRKYMHIKIDFLAGTSFSFDFSIF